MPSARRTTPVPVLLLCALHGCAAPSDWRGPLPTRNQHPAQLLVQTMTPRRAAVQEPGEATLRADAAYSNMFLSGSQNGDSFQMDGEYLRAALSAEVGLGSGFEIGLELPVAHTSGGFLDDFVIAYHELFGFPDQGRDDSPKDRFRVQATDDGQQVWGMQSEALELLDVPLTLVWSPTARGPEPGFGIALRAGLELPTGNDERGYGSGQVDSTLGIVLEQRTERAAFYGHLQHTWTGTPTAAREAGFTFRDVTAAGLGVELPWSASFAILAQVAFETSTLRDLQPREAERDQLLLWLGGRWQFQPAWSLEFGFGEDLIGHVSPDFTAWVGATWLPGR